MKTKIYVVPTAKGLDTLIERVADKAGISEEAAARAVDVVLTAVKGR
jgi:nucleoid DNA-binding protein